MPRQRCGPMRPMSPTSMPGAQSTASPPCRRHRKWSAPISPRPGRAMRCRPCGRSGLVLRAWQIWFTRMSIGKECGPRHGTRVGQSRLCTANTAVGVVTTQFATTCAFAFAGRLIGITTAGYFVQIAKGNLLEIGNVFGHHRSIAHVKNLLLLPAGWRVRSLWPRASC